MKPASDDERRPDHTRYFRGGKENLTKEYLLKKFAETGRP